MVVVDVAGLNDYLSGRCQAPYGQRNGVDFGKPSFSPENLVFRQQTQFCDREIRFLPDQAGFRCKSRFLTDKVGSSTDKLVSVVKRVSRLKSGFLTGKAM